MVGTVDTKNSDALSSPVYFVVGRGTEGGASDSYRLSVAGVTSKSWGDVSAVASNSGYSLGAIQVDLGQAGTLPLSATENRKLNQGEKTYVDAIIDESSAYSNAHGSMKTCLMSTMKFIFLLCLMAHVNHVFAASFNCSKAASPTEKLICNDAKTSAMDDNLQQAYRTAMAYASQPADKKALAKEQRNWIQYTRANCQDAICLQKIYAARIDVLRRNEKNIENDESYCTSPSGDKFDVHDCDISAQAYRDPNDHIESFNRSLVEQKKIGLIVQCSRLIRLSNGNHIGPGTGEQTFGGYCVLQVAKQRQDVEICKDDMAGDFQVQPVKPQNMSDKKLIEFTYKCSGN